MFRMAFGWIVVRTTKLQNLSKGIMMWGKMTDNYNELSMVTLGISE
jgi:hypothetical protein